MARSNGKRIGSPTSTKSKYSLGTAEEIGNRDKTGYQPPATNFQQIGPGDQGGNLNEPDSSRRRISGDSHFTSLP